MTIVSSRGRIDICDSHLGVITTLPGSAPRASVAVATPSLAPPLSNYGCAMGRMKSSCRPFIQRAADTSYRLPPLPSSVQSTRSLRVRRARRSVRQARRHAPAPFTVLLSPPRFPRPGRAAASAPSPRDAVATEPTHPPSTTLSAPRERENSL